MSTKFADFITDPAVCRAATEYWRQLFTNLPCRPLEHGWTEWGTTAYVDETGGNMFAAKDDQARRGIAIVMCPEISNRVQATAWTGWFGGDYDDGESIAYVKINVVHTDETEKLALALLKHFVCDGASLTQTDALIAEMGLDEQPL